MGFLSRLSIRQHTHISLSEYKHKATETFLILKKHVKDCTNLNCEILKVNILFYKILRVTGLNGCTDYARSVGRILRNLH